MAIGSLNVVSDFVIFILPMPLIWAMNLNANKRLEVMGIFGIASLACIASIVRLCYIVQLQYVPEGQVKYQLHVIRIGIWRYVQNLKRKPADCPEIKSNQIASNAELAIGVIVGCLPSLPKFFRHWRNKPCRPSARIFGTRSLDIEQTTSIWHRLRAIFNTKSCGPELKTPRQPNYTPKSMKHHITTLQFSSTDSPTLTSKDGEDMDISPVVSTKRETDIEAIYPYSMQTSLPPHCQNGLETSDTVSEVAQMYGRAL